MRGEALFVTSAGGVLLDAMALGAGWPSGRIQWVAVRALDTEELLAGDVARWVEQEPSPGRPASWLAELVAAWRMLGVHRPDWVVSAGTAVAVPWFVAARVRRIPCLWIETLNLHGPQGRAARLCTRLAERVLVQRPERLSEHRRVALVGELY